MRHKSQTRQTGAAKVIKVTLLQTLISLNPCKDRSLIPMLVNQQLG
jgi:hypothetical protein